MQDETVARRGAILRGVILLLVVLVILLAGVAWPWSAVLLVVAVVLEAGEIVLLRKWSRRLERRHPHVDPEDVLVGAVAEVTRPCRPRGQVRVGAELWEAVCADGADVGDSVVVDAVDGLELVVSRAASGAQAPAAGPVASGP